MEGTKRQTSWNNIIEGTKRQRNKGDEWRKKERSGRITQWYNI